ncbi:YibE/F family protein [Leuconostocaceae bacterium ESL0723]|nr:YibE/F family protein [Leuconostocaceae bacterium ESL0723]
MKLWHLIKKYGWLPLLLLVTWVGLRHDAFLYQDPVGQVVRVQTLNKGSVTDEHGNEDEAVSERLTIKLLNRSGQVQIDNGYAQSQAITAHYRVGDQVILSHAGGHNWQVFSLKRDALLGTLVLLFVSLLLIYGRLRAGGFLLLSLGLNLALFGLALVADIQVKSVSVVGLFATVAVAMAALSLFLVLGWGLQMGITWAATVLSTGLALIVMVVCLSLTHNEGVHFETMSYVTQVPKTLFYAQTIIGVLGAVMDESSDIIAALFGMHRENPNRPFHDYWQAGQSVGREILGTLVNILFMIFIAETIPMVILMLRNGNNWSYILDQVMNLGILQTVVSGLGIVLAVPVTALLGATFLVKRGDQS